MATVEAAGRREFLISRVWIQAVLLVVVCGFFVLGLLAYRTYMAHPPVPAHVVDPSGRTLFTGADHSVDTALGWADCLVLNDERAEQIVLLSAVESGVADDLRECDLETLRREIFLLEALTIEARASV